MPDRAWKAAALLICATVLAGNAWFLWVRRTPPSYDDAWYLEVSFRLFHALKKGLGAFAWEYAHSFRIKAPLISVLPLPLYALFGPSERVAAWANQFCLIASWRFIFLIGRRLYSEKAGWAAVIAAALLPILYGLSRVFFVECAEAAAVAAAQWSILSARPGKTSDAARLGVWLGLGLLIKSLFPLYLAGSFWLARKTLVPRAKLTLAIAAIIAGTWYAFNLVYVVGFGFSAGFGHLSHDYGAASAFSLPALSAYFKAIVFSALSLPYCIVAAALLIWALGKKARPGEPARFLIAWAALPFAVLAAGVNKEVRYLDPLLPALAIALGACAAEFARTPGKTAILALMLALPVSVFSAQTFGYPAAEPLAYNGPPSRFSGWDRSAVVEAVYAQVRLQQPEVQTSAAVALEHSLFNANNLSSLAAERGYPLKFINLGYAQGSLPAAIIRLKDKDARYLVTVDGLSSRELPGFLNRVNGEMVAQIERGGLGAKLLNTLVISPGITAKVYSIRP